jgi:hypothetical protein
VSAVVRPVDRPAIVISLPDLGFVAPSCAVQPEAAVPAGRTGRRVQRAHANAAAADSPVGAGTGQDANGQLRIADSVVPVVGGAGHPDVLGCRHAGLPFQDWKGQYNLAFPTVASRAEDQEVLSDLARLTAAELSALDVDELVSGTRQAEYLVSRAPMVSGRLFDELHRRLRSWPEVARLTGVTQSTAFRRADAYRDSGEG